MTDELKVIDSVEKRLKNSPQIQFSAITLFPEMFSSVTEYGVVGRAVKAGLIKISCINPRNFTEDRHRTVDDRPYGGGPGMLMKVEPLERSILSIKEKHEDAKVIYLSPQGRTLNHQLVKELTKESHLVLLSGRYEGVDQRLIDQQVDIEISIGDFVLSGGELAAMTVIDSVTRMLPSALGHNDSAEEDSFEDGLLDHPHYTRPELYNDVNVPSILLGGDHQAIKTWRLKQRLGNTWLKRPDLLEKKNLSDSEQKLLEDFKSETNA